MDGLRESANPLEFGCKISVLFGEMERFKVPGVRGDPAVVSRDDPPG